MKKRQKAGFLSPKSSKIIVTKENEKKERARIIKERRRRKKNNGCTLSFQNSYFGATLLLDAKGLFGNKVIKNLARFIYTVIRTL